MNKKAILKRLEDTTIDSHERESLSQLLHYMQVENIQDTTTTNKQTRTNQRRTNTNKYKPKR